MDDAAGENIPLNGLGKTRQREHIANVPLPVVELDKFLFARMTDTPSVPRNVRDPPEVFQLPQPPGKSALGHGFVVEPEFQRSCGGFADNAEKSE